MRIYIHDSAGKRVVEADEAATLAEVVGAEGDLKLWAEDASEPLAPDASVGVLRELEVVAVHVGKGQVSVTVSYNGGTKTDSFGPGTKIDKVLDWATSVEEFNIPAGDRDDLVLRLKGSTEALDPDTHIGTLVGKGDSLALDLVSGDKFAG